MATIALPRLRRVLLLLAAYALWKFYRAPMEGFVEDHPARREHRPDAFGR